MNSKLVLHGLAVVLVGASLLHAGDPWKDKPYTEWTQKDVQKVFQNSPWARKVTILLGPAGSGGEGSPAGQPAAARAGSYGESSGAAIAAQSSSAARGGGDFPAQANQQAVFFVVWASSLTVRQALMRQQELQGKLDAEAARQLLTVHPDQYEVIILGPDLRGFEELGEEAMRQSAYLESRPHKARISPTRAQFVRQGSSLVEVRFFFPRAVENRAVIGPDEQEVIFSCRTRSFTVKTDFSLRKMVRESAPDL